MLCVTLNGKHVAGEWNTRDYYPEEAEALGRELLASRRADRVTYKPMGMMVAWREVKL
jgi:hypothetical protein